MAWTAPRTWVAGEIVTASIMNSAVRDNLRYLKGLDGVPTIESGLTIDNSDGDERLLLPLLSTAECTSVLNAEGEVAFDEQTHRIKFYDNDSVVSVVGTDDVDDTPVNGATTDPISSNWAYDHIATLTTRGDIIFRNATVWARLAKGTEGQVLRQGTNDPEWASAVATHEFFTPFAFVGTGTAALYQDYGVITLDATHNCSTSFKVPHDFSTLTSCLVVGIHTATENIDWTVVTDFAAVGEACTTHSDTATANAVAMTAANTASIDVSDALTGLLADDYVGLKFTLDTAAAGDFHVLGLAFKYT